MTAIAISLIVFVCVFGGALLGMFLRTVLPEHHLSEESKYVVQVATGLIATLAALVLGLLVASTKTSFDALNDEFRQTAARIILLDRTLAQYGPETKDIRELIQKRYADQLARLFPQDQSQRSTLVAAGGAAAVEDIQHRLRALSPQNALQRSVQSDALEITNAVAQTRWLEIEQVESTLPTPFLVVLVFWLAAMFTSFGLFAPRNATAIAVLFVAALSVSASIFLIAELNGPLAGFITISSAPMYKALALLGQ